MNRTTAVAYAGILVLTLFAGWMGGVMTNQWKVDALQARIKYTEMAHAERQQELEGIQVLHEKDLQLLSLQADRKFEALRADAHKQMFKVQTDLLKCGMELKFMSGGNQMPKARIQ